MREGRLTTLTGCLTIVFTIEEAQSSTFDGNKAQTFTQHPPTMTPFKNFSQHTAPHVSWKNRARRGSFYLAVAALLSVHTTSCGSGDDNGQDWEQVTVQEPTKGVVTTIEETEAGKFAITDEQVVSSKDSSRVVIKRLDGSSETLTLDQARHLVQPQDTAGTHSSSHTTGYRHHSGGLGGVLWWGAMGYMMGRSFNTPVNPGIYRDDRRTGFSGGNSGTGGAAYRTGSTAASELQRTAVSRTTMRPVSGKSGFFGGSSRSKASGG